MFEHKLKNNKKIATVILNIKGKDWKEFLDKSFKELSKNLKVKGFREGKVPIEIAKKNLGNKEIWNEAIDIFLKKNYSEIISKFKDLKIVDEPKLEVNKVSDEELELSVEFSLLPEITLGDYKNFGIKYIKPNFTKEEFEEEMKNSEDYFIEAVELKDEKELSKNGDILNINFVGKIDGKVFENGSGNNHDLELGSKSFIDNFEEQLIGLKKNDSKKVSVKFPEVYPEDSLKGKQAEFDVKVNFIKRKQKLEGKKLEEKFQLYNIANFKELEDRTKKILIDRKTREENDKFINKFLEKIEDLNKDVVIPTKLLKEESEREFKDFVEKLKEQGLEKKQYLEMLGSTEEELKEKQILPSVTKKIKRSLIYSDLLDELKISLTEKDFEKEWKKIAELQKVSLEEIKKEISKQILEDSLIFEKLVTKLSNITK